MNESTHRFGRDGHLAGIVCQPAPAQDGQGEPTDLAVVMTNAGFIHHVGPWQLHVDLARRLASRGIPSVRFDLSGLGDSEIPKRRESVSARTINDIQDAIELLATTCGARRIIMAGLCSGAVDAHRAAQEETRVVGAALLDPPAYPDRLYHVIRWAERVLNPVRVFRFLRRKLIAALGRGAQADSKPAPEPWRPMTAEAFAEQVETATQRGIEYLFCYAGTDEYKYRGQLLSILTPGTPRERVTIYHYRNMEHTPVLIEDRRIIADTLTQWIRERFF